MTTPDNINDKGLDIMMILYLCLTVELPWLIKIPTIQHCSNTKSPSTIVDEATKMLNNHSYAIFTDNQIDTMSTKVCR